MKNNNLKLGYLYIIATPIGNFNDISKRALITLNKVDYILAEDTRKIGILLKFFNIKKKIYSYYEYNEKKKINFFLKKINQGYNIALVSDAGTPLINDPGYRIVQLCRTKYINIKIIPIPGPCAAILALSISGLPTNRFCYEGFLPHKKNKRIKRLNELKLENRTLILYESTHRILKCLYDIKKIFGKDRYIVFIKELTKKWESIYGNNISNLIKWLKLDVNRLKGEIVLVIKGYKESINSKDQLSPKVIQTFLKLKKELSIKKAIKITSDIFSIKKNLLYKFYIKKNTNYNNNKVE
ncbi:16S rRNA (cytidine(1402)-2'-O)-methyltransferase [Enterobacteriaceae endosymbiont of Donacia bicoloricornis]|uniref:16S rRNA (cytidine(1402)-2'-O)-methyltransferase n=1 Tax=Enterobacteriaceae endosymbiont of Donacia bicoloricornis TaxID=2675772 RepID=UPI001449B2C5|nr:16S rRNA (cytidine(1402)-2'-O)-methyltransferase [Enterobacteriaceae endosymbiont of Donacia bicoloricornis]QJC37560.1 16S rRNA (cytidine(1402)-2'-O)-methyltransferase [Enterobacteriaceae endosymbiont of Donacia bicoloricornis]